MSLYNEHVIVAIDKIIDVHVKNIVSDKHVYLPYKGRCFL